MSRDGNKIISARTLIISQNIFLYPHSLFILFVILLSLFLVLPDFVVFRHFIVASLYLFLHFIFTLDLWLSGTFNFGTFTCSLSFVFFNKIFLFVLNRLLYYFLRQCWFTKIEVRLYCLNFSHTLGLQNCISFKL